MSTGKLQKLCSKLSRTILLQLILPLPLNGLYCDLSEVPREPIAVLHQSHQQNTKKNGKLNTNSLFQNWLAALISDNQISFWKGIVKMGRELYAGKQVMQLPTIHYWRGIRYCRLISDGQYKFHWIVWIGTIFFSDHQGMTNLNLA